MVITALFVVNLAISVLVFTHMVDIDRQIRRKIEMSVQETIDAVVEQLSKAKGELLGEIDKLRASLSAAEVAHKVDVSGLVAVAQALDDIVADDVPVVEVVEELPADDAGVEPADSVE